LRAPVVIFHSLTGAAVRIPERLAHSQSGLWSESTSTKQLAALVNLCHLIDVSP